MRSNLDKLGEVKGVGGLEMLRSQSVVLFHAFATKLEVITPISGHCSELKTESSGSFLTKGVMEFLRLCLHLLSVRVNVQFPAAYGWVKVCTRTTKSVCKPMQIHT